MERALQIESMLINDASDCCVIAEIDLPANHVNRRADVAIKSPSDGLPPFELDRVIGKLTPRALKEDENINFENVDGNI